MSDARAAYTALVDRIHTDGYPVENYQFPLIADERWARSTLLQRLLGLVDVRTDREVWMLYTSVFPGRIGPGLLWTYAPQAQAVGVGSTGGGPDIPGHPQVPALDWDALARDLRLARHWCDDLLIHSLEGCVGQGFLPRLRSFDWEQAEAPPETARLAAGLRDGLRLLLWASAHPWHLLGLAVAAAWLISHGATPTGGAQSATTDGWPADSNETIGKGTGQHLAQRADPQGLHLWGRRDA